jgi:heme iron utilization protein
MKMPNLETENLIRDLLNSQRLAVLSTQSLGQPYGNLIAFASSPDLKNLIFATPRNTRKYGNLIADPRVALLIDNRSNQPEDFARAAAVTVMGRTRELAEEELSGFLKIYLDKHPSLRDFVSSPPCALFTVEVEKFILVSGLRTIRELQMRGNN